MNATPFCVAAGSGTLDGSLGTPELVAGLPAWTAPAPGESPAPGEAPIVVKVQSSTSEARFFALGEGRYAVGSSSQCHVQICSASGSLPVKPLHCTLTVADGRVQAAQWGTGALLNGGAFTTAALQRGDKLELGATVIEISERPPRAAELIACSPRGCASFQRFLESTCTDLEPAHWVRRRRSSGQRVQAFDLPTTDSSPRQAFPGQASAGEPREKTILELENQAAAARTGRSRSRALVAALRPSRQTTHELEQRFNEIETLCRDYAARCQSTLAQSVDLRDHNSALEEALDASRAGAGLLQDEIRALEQRVAEKTAAIQQLEMETIALRSDRHADDAGASQECDRLRRELTVAFEESATLRDRLTCEEQAHREKTAEAEQSRTEQQSLAQRLAEQSTRLEELVARLQNAESQVAESAEMQERCAQLSDQLSQRERELADASAVACEVAALRDQLAERDRQHGEVAAHMASITERLEELQTQLATERQRSAELEQCAH